MAAIHPIRLRLVVGLALAPAACGHPAQRPGVAAPSPAPDVASDEAGIRRALADWVEATRAGDRLSAARIWAPDLVGWYPGHPDDTYEREQEFARRPRPPDAPSSIPSVTVVEVIVSGDLAVVRDIWRFTRIAGADTTFSSLRGFEVWRRQPDGAWRIARWISAPDPNPRP